MCGAVARDLEMKFEAWQAAPLVPIGTIASLYGIFTNLTKDNDEQGRMTIAERASRVAALR